MSKKDYDFIVGFTIFGNKGFKTMYRHFNSLETAKLFANNINIKDNNKIYVDLDYFNKEKEMNKKLEKENLELNNLIEELKKRFGFNE